MALLYLGCGDDAVAERADGSVGGDVDAAVGSSDAARAPSAPATSGEFLALTYNVAGLPEGLSGSMPANYTPLIAPLLNGYELVLLQESWQTPDPNTQAPTRVYHEILVEGSKHPYKSEPAEQPLGTDPERPSALLGDGLNQFSNFEFDEVMRTRWETCVETASDCLALKGFSAARTTFADGATIDVYNLHMEAGSSAEDEIARDAGIDQLVAFMRDFSDGRAVIVGGDFNLHTDEEPDMSQFARLLEETGLTDVCTALACDKPGKIDKFLFRSGGGVSVEPVKWSEETATFMTEDGLSLSDHEPVATLFAWSIE